MYASVLLVQSCAMMSCDEVTAVYGDTPACATQFLHQLQARKGVGWEGQRCQTVNVPPPAIARPTSPTPSHPNAPQAMSVFHSDSLVRREQGDKPCSWAGSPKGHP